jgi:molybdenum-dependent DNA-binding transcriptional regulator ModE
MELRHLRYFVAVAETGSLTVAAEQKLHTSQPSLSRQIRDLEDEIGTPLLTRRARGIELTSAGRAFLDHARSVLSQVEAAAEAARRIAHPAKPRFSLGFLTGHEFIWMPEALRILRDELPNIDVMISSQDSPLPGECFCATSSLCETTRATWMTAPFTTFRGPEHVPADTGHLHRRQNPGRTRLRREAAEAVYEARAPGHVCGDGRGREIALWSALKFRCS